MPRETSDFASKPDRPASRRVLSWRKLSACRVETHLDAWPARALLLCALISLPIGAQGPPPTPLTGAAENGDGGRKPGPSASALTEGSANLQPRRSNPKKIVDVPRKQDACSRARNRLRDRGIIDTPPSSAAQTNLFDRRPGISGRNAGDLDMLLQIRAEHLLGNTGCHAQRGWKAGYHGEALEQ